MSNRKLLQACLENGAEVEPWQEFINRFRHIVANAATSTAQSFGQSPDAFVAEV